MSELKAALQAILNVNFREPMAAKEQSQISDFLERAARELVQREQDVAEREKQVSQREANVSVREDNAEQQAGTLASCSRLARALEMVPVQVKRGSVWSLRRG